MRTLFVTVGDTRSASTRVRVLEPAAELRRRGQVVAIPSIARGRLLAALTRRWDTIVLQKVVPGPRALTALRSRTQRLVFECDDAIQLGYPGEPPGVAAVRAARIEQVLARCDGVTTTNPLLARDFQTPDRRSLVLAGPAPALLPPHEPREQVAVWVGSASTSPNLLLLEPSVAMLARRGWRVEAVGVDPAVAARIPGLVASRWSPDLERAALTRATVGVMPLERSAWNDRKAAYKVLTYLAAGVVPVVSESPAARCVVDEAAAVFVPSGGSWSDAVSEAADTRRERMGPGLEAWNRLSIDAWVDRWLDFVGEL